ncbi:uncharacterized protein LOC143282806 [Babylonia areolata]|uniref:uncharacterized protein LOC143282806 n=1 Tax=Babylonia areolata TaxID=304850 RepID=UPI003FD326FE
MADMSVGGMPSTTHTLLPGDPQHRPPQTDVGGGGGGEGEGRPGRGWRMGEEGDGLLKAASEGQTDRVKQLLQDGASLHPDQEGRTALHFAAQNGHAEVCKVLVQGGCELDLQDTMGYTALLRASSQGVVDVVRVLLEAGCAVDFADHHGNTAVHEATWHGFSQTVQLLIKYNADVFRVNQSGFTALHLGAQNGHNESCRVLLYGGVDPDLQNNYGDTALHTAARYGHAGVTRILISARCKLNLPNKNGDTALHIAAALKRRKITKILMESGVDIHVRNKQNETPIDVARRKEHPEVILLITSLSRPHSAGPKTRDRDMGGVTFKDDLEDKGPVVCADNEAPIKADKPDKERRLFPFFRKKKKDKEKDKAGQSPQPVGRVGSGGRVQPTPPPKPVSGFFSQYMPRSGTQYYRDLAGNIKQGPVGYTPVCQCGPAMHHIEKSMHHTKEILYQHIDASHQVLQDRIEQLDRRTSQQAHSLDRLTQERLQEERRACQSALEERLVRERHRTQYTVESYSQDLQGHLQDWLEQRLASYGHCLDHHHDDSALPPARLFTDVHFGPDGGGRLFRSRSDETLSVSDYSGKGRKRHFYESRKAAMEQIRGWKVPASASRGANKELSSSPPRRQERGRSTDNLDRRGRREGDGNNATAAAARGFAHADGTRGQGRRSLGNIHRTVDRQPDGASPSHHYHVEVGGGGARVGEEGEGRIQKVKERHVGFSPQEEEQEQHAPASSQGAIPKRPSLSSPFQSHHHHHHQSSKLQSQSRQSRSHSNLPSSHAPPPATTTAQPVSSHHPPAASQQPPRGILRSHTHDAALHQRTADSSFGRQQQQQQQQPNLEERGPRGHSTGPEPGERGDPSTSQPDTGSAAAAGHAGNARVAEEWGRERLYSTSQSQSLSSPQVVLQFHSASPGLTEVVTPPRPRPRAHSVDAILDEVDSGKGGGDNGCYLGKGEDSAAEFARRRQFSSSVLAGREQSGYATDSGVRRHGDGGGGFGQQGYLPYRPQSEDRQRSEGPVVRSMTASGNDASRSLSGQREDSSRAVHDWRHASKERTSGYFTDSEVKRSPQGQGPHSVKPSFPMSPTRQQDTSPFQRQPATRYRVLPPLPPAGAHVGGERTKPQVAPKPAPPSRGVGDKWSSSDRTVSPQVGAKESTSADKTVTTGRAPPYNGGTRTPSPFCTPQGGSTPAANPHHQSKAGGSGQKGASRSQSSLAQDWDKFSPRDMGSVSSGRYSVSRGCLQHDSYADSPLSLGGNSKEPSTCSSNQDSGYIDHHPHPTPGGGGERGGRGGEGESTTPSSSFSMDRSSSLGLPSSSGSPYMHLGGGSHSCGGDLVPPPSATWQPSSSEGQKTQPSSSGWIPSILASSKPGANSQAHTGGAPPHVVRDSSASGLSRQQPTPTPTTPIPSLPVQATTTTGGGGGRLEEQGRRGAGGEVRERWRGAEGAVGSLLNRQVQGWYQQRLLEAAQRLRNSEQYSQQPGDDGDGRGRQVARSSATTAAADTDTYDWQQQHMHTGERYYAFSKQSFSGQQPGHDGYSASKQYTHQGDSLSKKPFTNQSDSFCKQYTPASDIYNKQYTQSSDSYNKQYTHKQYPHSSDSYKQYPQSGDSYNRQYPHSSDSYSKQYTHPTDSYKQHGQPGDGYNKQYTPTPSHSHQKQYTHPSDSYSKQYTHPSDSYQQHSQPGDGYNKQYQYTPPSDCYNRQYTSPSDGHKQNSHPGETHNKQYTHPGDAYNPSYGQSANSGRPYGKSVHDSSTTQQSVDGGSGQHYGRSADSAYWQHGQRVDMKQYGQVVDSFGSGTKAKQYGGGFTTIPIHYDPVNGSDV